MDHLGYGLVKILVTGGHGYLGSNIVDVLSLTAHEVIITDKNPNSIGYNCDLISAKFGDGVDNLIAKMKNKTCMISGHSGVGKSTLINYISPGLSLKTKEISSSHNQGQHTTTHAEMFDLDSNIRVIDTPGIRGFGLVDISKNELGDFFPEFFKAKDKCKFKDCLHLDEPNCNIKSEIINGEIFESRYNTYLGYEIRQ